MSFRRFGVELKAYGCTGAPDAPRYGVFWPLYMLPCVLWEEFASRGNCWELPWKASEEDGREWSIVIVLEGVIGSGSTSAIGSPVVQDGSRRAEEQWEWASGAGR